MVAEELDETLVPITDEPARHSLYDAIVNHVRNEPPAPKLNSRPCRPSRWSGPQAPSAKRAA